MPILNHKIYQSNSDNTPVLIMHGLFGMLDNWNSIAKKLSDSMPVHVLDLRNHGRSFHHPDMDYEVMADDVLEYMDEQDLSEVNLIGHSMGGKVALNIARKYPYVVEKMVVADMGIRAYQMRHGSIIEALKSINIAQVQDRKEIQQQLLNKLDGSVAITSFLMKSVYRKENSYAYRFNLSALSENLPLLGQAIKFEEAFIKPVLYIRGTQSDYVQNEDLKQARDVFPKFNSVDLVAGHWVHAERPAEFLGAMLNFL